MPPTSLQESLAETMTSLRSGGPHSVHVPPEVAKACPIGFSVMPRSPFDEPQDITIAAGQVLRVYPDATVAFVPPLAGSMPASMLVSIGKSIRKAMYWLETPDAETDD